MVNLKSIVKALSNNAVDVIMVAVNGARPEECKDVRVVRDYVLQAEFDFASRTNHR